MDKKNLLILGGTGSLGKSLLKHFSNEYNVSVFSRDEAKHVVIKGLFPNVKSLIGDIRDRDAVFSALLKARPDIIINATALKNVPEVEEVPMEGIKTSLTGTDNLNQAASLYTMYHKDSVKILTVSTDKACKPVNSYGMAKALQERLHIRSNSPELICNAVRYGNVLESRGSLIPLIKERLLNNEPIYITHPEMSRFFLTLDNSVELIKIALKDNNGGKLFIPQIRSAKILDVMKIFCKRYNKDFSFIKEAKIRPGEKIDEILISIEETGRTERVDDVYVIHDILSGKEFNHIFTELSSGSDDILLTDNDLESFLDKHGVFHDTF